MSSFRSRLLLKSAVHRYSPSKAMPYGIIGLPAASRIAPGPNGAMVKVLLVARCVVSLIPVTRTRPVVVARFTVFQRKVFPAIRSPSVRQFSPSSVEYSSRTPSGSLKPPHAITFGVPPVQTSPPAGEVMEGRTFGTAPPIPIWNIERPCVAARSVAEA